MGAPHDIDRGEPSRPGSDFLFDPLSAGLGFLILQAVPIIVGGLLVQAGLPLSELSELDRMAWSMGAFLLASVCVLAYGWFGGRRIRWGTARPLGVFGLWVLGFALFMAVLIGYLELRRALDHPIQPQDVMQALGGADGAQWWFLATMAVLIAPVVEEVVFRGMIQDALRRIFDPVSAIVLTGIVFGLVHGVQYAPPLAVAGVFFGWLRERSGGLWAPILAHALHNATVLLMAVAAPSVTEWMYRSG